MFIKGLGETYMTIERRILLLRLRFIKSENPNLDSTRAVSKLFIFSTRRKFSRENSLFLKVHTARRIMCVLKFQYK